MHQPIDDHFLLKYRSLLDAEDVAFDELEHACEEGDRTQFDKDMVDWQSPSSTSSPSCRTPASRCVFPFRPRTEWL